MRITLRASIKRSTILPALAKWSVALALLLVSPAAAEIRWVGKPAAADRAKLQAIYDKAPAGVKRVDVWVQVDRSRDQGKYLWESGKRRIVTPPKASSFAHELGHHAHTWCRNWADWPEFFREHRNLMPDAYSRSLAREGYAESFGRWLLREELHPKVRAWFDQHWTE